MGEIKDIKDRESLEAWLNALPQETEEEQATARRIAVSIAFRAAARVMPEWWEYTLTSEHARKRELTALPILRNLLISSVAALVPTEYIRNAADAAAVWESIRQDADVLWGSRNEESQASQVFSQPLWHGDLPNEEQWIKIQNTLRETGQDKDWAFWLDWYIRLLSGTALAPDHPMLVEIALLPDALWQDEPAALKRINEIWERYQLLEQAQALSPVDSQSLTTSATSTHRRHNMPPELVDEVTQIAAIQTQFGEVMETVIDELSQPEPEKGKLAACAESLIALCKSFANYCGSVANEGIKAGAKVVGAGGGTYLLNQLSDGKVLEFAERLLQFATK